MGKTGTQVISSIVPAVNVGTSASVAKQPAVTDAPAEPPPPPADRDAPHPWALNALAAWVALAAAGQMVHVASWPMYLIGVPVTHGAAVVVAFIRLALYAGLAWGLRQRQRTAWAGIVFELWRTFINLILLSAGRDLTLSGSIYPASWAQALLSAVLPLLVALNTGLKAGWSPGADLELYLSIAARVLSAVCVLAGLWLRRQAASFGVPTGEEWTALLREGLPIAFALSAAEAAAYFFGRGG